jgi:hypothetical protein
MANNDVVTPELIKPSAPENRTKAYRIRRDIKNHADVSTEDMEWLHSYEEAQRVAKGASRTHKVQYTEESAEAVGTGDAAAYAAAMAAPQLAKEEGRRIDQLILAAVQATTMANKATQAAYEMVLRMGSQLLERNGQLENVHLGMLDAIREGHLAKTNAEAELIRRDAESAGNDEGGINGMVSQLMPVILQELTKKKMIEKK